jgi:hypothetical protein
MQKFKGRVLVADWSVPKNEFSNDKAPQDGPPEKTHATASPRAAQANTGRPGKQIYNAGGHSVSECEASKAKTCKRKEDSAAEADENDLDDDPEAPSDAALHVKPAEKRMYEDLLAGLLSEKHNTGTATKEAVTGQSRAAADCKNKPEKKQAKDAAVPVKTKKGADGNLGARPAWEGERSEAPAVAKEEGSGLIQRQVFVRDLPLDVLPSELSSCMQRFGGVKACRSAAASYLLDFMHTVFLKVLYNIYKRLNASIDDLGSI